jgi:hypothetical protein
MLDEKLTLQAARRRLAEDRTRIDPVGQLGLLLPEPDPVAGQDMDREQVIRDLREVLDILRFGRKSW